jgi:Plavaka transposase
LLTKEALEQDKPGATIIPLIISTDKTQLTVFCNKSAYPVYLTIGNIPKEIRRKPSSHTYMLIGYLPTTHLQHITNASARRCLIANLYHACMRCIFLSVVAASHDRTFMTSGHRITYRVHPLLACIVGDYPEHVLTTCVFNGECPTCPVDRNQLGEFKAEDGPALCELATILEALNSFDNNSAGFLQACKNVSIRPVFEPYWKDLPYSHINRSIMPDILHQMYQGIMKHLIRWIIKACGASEIDARCWCMPPNHNVQLFMKGISSLSHVSGVEHGYMCQILLGLVINVQLPGRLSNARLITCMRALLDFLYFA